MPAKKQPSQMQLGEKIEAPKVPEQAFLEYPGPDGMKWRVEHWSDLRKEFELKTTDEMCRLHTALAAEQRAWRLVRLLYWIAPLVGETEREFMQSHSRNEVAAKMAIDPVNFDAEVTAIRTFWKKTSTLAKAAEKQQPVKISTRLAELKDDKEANDLLKSHGFGDIEGDARMYVLDRILDLTGELEESKGRPIAQRAIRMELRMQSFERMLRDLDEEYVGAAQQKKSTVRKEITEITKSLKDLQAEYRSLMEDLNLTQGQNQSLRKKAKIEVSLSGMISAIREYESRGDTELCDGVFQAAEVQLLLRPMSIRAPQYRPDLVAVIREAMKEENLFNPNWTPPEMNRADYRRFRRAVQSGLKSLEEGEEVVDLEEDDDEAPPASHQPDRIDDGFSGTIRSGPEPQQQGGGMIMPPPRPGMGGEPDFLIN